MVYTLLYSRDGMSTRKLMTVLAVGFGIGFLLGILVLSPKKAAKLSLNRVSPCRHLPDRPKTLSGSYESWLSNQRVSRKPLDVDDFLYGSSKDTLFLESEWLKKKVNITCVVFVEVEKNVRAASQTWLSHCNDYVFFHAKKPHDLKGKSFAPDLRIEIVEAKNSWDFLCKSILSLWKSKKDTMQWLLFVSDNMFVIPENLRRLVAHLNWNDPYYLGHAQSLWGQPFNVALSGYVLSKGAVRRLAGNYTFESCVTGGKYWKKEDYYLGKNLEKLCIFPGDTRDKYGKGSFHGYNLNQLLFSNKLALIASYWKDSIYPLTEGKSCCSDLSVTFQGIEADKMYMYNYIINHLRVFTHGLHGNQPAPTPYPEEEVWQAFMRSQGFSQVTNISAKQYFDAWKSKINEDLTKAGFKKKNHIWRGLDLKNGDGHGEVIPLPFQFESVMDAE